MKLVKGLTVVCMIILLVCMASNPTWLVIPVIALSGLGAALGSRAWMRAEGKL